ncbi:MAG: alkaline phosphatase family protein [Nitrospiraceae bacterium]
MSPSLALAEVPVPTPDHVVIVVLENHSYSSIIGSPDAPFINGLAARGALMTQYYGMTHPSQPNYIGLFSGSLQGVTGNDCPLTLQAPNLGHALLTAGKTFAGFSEGLPEVGSTVCAVNHYTRKHSPWVAWQHSGRYGLPPSVNRPLSEFPKDYAQLPTVSIVIPNNLNNMHDGTDPDRIRQADTWVRDRIGGYADWVQAHKSLLILTWDEDNGKENNRVPTILIGPMVKAGQSAQRLSHPNLLRTLEVMYQLPPVVDRPGVEPYTGVWNAAPTPP